MLMIVPKNPLSRSTQGFFTIFLSSNIFIIKNAQADTIPCINPYNNPNAGIDDKPNTSPQTKNFPFSPKKFR
jgi:hypothetical protein